MSPAFNFQRPVSFAAISTGLPLCVVRRAAAAPPSLNRRERGRQEHSATAAALSILHEVPLEMGIEATAEAVIFREPRGGVALHNRREEQRDGRAWRQDPNGTTAR